MDRKIEKKITEAYDLYTEAIFRFCYFKTNDRELSKDLMQQTFLKTIEYMRDGHKIDNIRAFLYRIAGNMVIDWYRKKKESSLEEWAEQGFELVDKTVDIKMNAEIELLHSHLNKLDSDDRGIMILRYVEDLSPKEIAEILGENVNSVSVKIFRATEKLKKILHE